MNLGYYSVIPSFVRYDKDLCPNAKLLYGEITSLCNKEGYCWAGNEYFSELYDTTDRTITRWIAQLNEKEYIKISLETKRYEDGTVKKIRTIYINDHLDKNEQNHIDIFRQNHIDKNVLYNNKEDNNKEEEIYKEENSNFKKPTIDEIAIYCNERNNGIDAEKFYNYYESVGWLIGKQRMKDWKACVRTWEGKNKEKAQNARSNYNGTNYTDTQLIKTEEGTFKLR